ncbi:MAG: L-aspartate oxidase [Bacteroidota bacterium]
MSKKVDFLVLGSGIAGLSYALKVADHGKVLVVAKGSLEETATRYAQGGIASVTYEPDNFEKHMRDTIDAGDEMSDPDIVKMTITEAPDRVRELVHWGVRFDRTDEGQYELGREGGHSEKRVLHHKDRTGYEIQQALLNAANMHPNIELAEGHYAVDIITQHHLGQTVTRRTPDVTCFGAYILNPKIRKVYTVLSRFTMLATGGAGNIYNSTTNPLINTGDGVAMVYRAKGQVEKMEFVQFHPTALYNPGESPVFLITEALRGFGAILKNKNGEAFMKQYDKRESLAPRDIVARAIDNEMKVSGHDHVCLDCTHLNSHELIDHFPGIYAKCMSINIDITKEMIPVVPAAHYMVGGVKVDKYAQTSIKNLFASGESASTGLHGANRLASNSLLESLVFSHRASQKSRELLRNTSLVENIPQWNDEGTTLNEEMILITQSKKELQDIMSNYVGIVRSNLRLKRALDRLKIIYKETETLYERSILSIEICELRNMINTAYLVIKMATERKESRGLHYSINYPKENS